MKKTFFTAILVGAVFTLRAQSTQDSVIAAVNQLFAGMKNADTVMLKNSFSPSAVLQTIKEDSSGVKVIDEKVDDFVGFVGKETVGAADEQIKVETVKVDGPLAMVWASYKFYYKGKFSHCGIDAFQLARLNGSWKIQYIIDTRRKSGCL